MKLFTLLLLPAFFASQYGMAQIGASVTSGCAPLAGVQFTNSYSNPSGIDWDFDDGASSNLPNPSHNFALPGTYVVTFNAVVGGNPVSDEITIEVYDVPDPSFNITSVANGCTGLQVSFDDTSIGGGGAAIDEWNWAFGDGGVNTVNTGVPIYQY